MKLERRIWRWWKRGFDIIVSIVLMVTVFWWLIPVIAVLQKLLNPGPIFYNTRRTGREGKEFVCHKFRSLIPNAANRNGQRTVVSVVYGDDRATQFGIFLRHTNLDELPQFFNVLKGEMSIVGPRPHDIIESNELALMIPSYTLRHRVCPGITGWAQVNGHHGTTSDINKMHMRTGYDLWYINSWSFGLDLEIVVRTAWRMAKLVGINLGNFR